MEIVSIPHCCKTEPFLLKPIKKEKGFETLHLGCEESGNEASGVQCLCELTKIRQIGSLGLPAEVAEVCSGKCSPQVFCFVVTVGQTENLLILNEGRSGWQFCCLKRAV